MVSNSTFSQYLDTPASQTVVPVALRRAMLGERFLTEQHAALNNRDCEDFLKICVEQLGWIKSAESSLLESLRDPNRHGPRIDSEIVGQMFQAIRELYQGWQLMSDKVDVWIATLRQKKLKLNNEPTFEEAKQYANRRITQFANEDFIYEDIQPEEAAEARAILGL